MRLAAMACTLAIGIALDAIVRGLQAFAPVNGRLQRKASLPDGALVIDDTYNANPDSVRAAIDVLAQYPAPRILVLGDMGEVGDQGPAFHIEIGAYAKSAGIETLLALGEFTRETVSAFGAARNIDASLEELLAMVAKHDNAGATILVKGIAFHEDGARGTASDWSTNSGSAH